MPYSEAQEKYYQAVVLPEVEAFHAAHPLFWDVKEGQAVEDNELDSDSEDDFVIDRTKPAVLGKKFLDATNVWLRNPELPTQQKLSIEGRRYLEEISWVIDNAKKNLVETANQDESKDKADIKAFLSMPIKDYLDTIKFGDQSIDEYLETIATKAANVQEYDYIVDIVNKVIIHVGSFRQKLLMCLETGDIVPKTITDPLHRTKKHWLSPR